MLNISPALIIFDCDGVLVDSEPIANRILAQSLSKEGYECSFEDSIEKFVGRDLTTIVNQVETELGRELSERFFEQLQAQTYATFQKYLKPVPGIGAVLGKISLPKCVASSGTIDKIEFTLTLTGLRHHFGSAVFSASQVPRGKPYPDLFLHAAQQFSVSPNACIVVEDSIPGVLGARAAGMHVLGYAGGTHVRPNHDHLLTEAGAQVFLSMTSLPKLLTTKFE